MTNRLASSDTKLNHNQRVMTRLQKSRKTRVEYDISEDIVLHDKNGKAVTIEAPSQLYFFEPERFAGSIATWAVLNTKPASQSTYQYTVLCDGTLKILDHRKQRRHAGGRPRMRGGE